MEYNDKQDKELIDLRNEFHSVASTHVTFGLFTWVLGVIITIGMVSISFLYARSVTNSDKIDSLEAEQNKINIVSAKIQEQLATIQATLLEIKVDLKTHAR